MDKLIVVLIVVFIEIFVGILLKTIFNIEIIFFYMITCSIVDIPLACILDEK